MTTTVSLQEKQFICPGETHPISRSVHLSRLAAFYPTCRDCPLRTDTGQLYKRTVERLQLTERRVQRKSLFTIEGVRGVYINELTRKKAGEMATALAALLWEKSPLVGRAGALDRGNRPKRPSVVVGYDERPSSPDIVNGVAAALRRMGCEVLDISLTTKPCFWFAVDHLQSDAGVFVTGAGCDPSWTGLDFVGRQSLPLSQLMTVGNQSASTIRLDPDRNLNLNQIEEQLHRPISRSTRHAGPHRTFQAAVPYEAGLWKHFHALRPLTVACACPNRLTRQTLERIFETLPCRLIPVEIPHRVRNPVDAKDADVLRLGTAVRKQQAHVGVLIDEDSGRCGFVDESGQLVTARQITRLIGEFLLSQRPAETVVIERGTFDNLRPIIESAGGTTVDGGTTLAEIAQAARDHHAIFAGGDSGRYWFHESSPACDAILTLAQVLAILSRSDAPFSVVAESATTNS